MARWIGVGWRWWGQVWVRKASNKGDTQVADEAKPNNIPPFVASIGGKPSSGIQLSFLIGGDVVTIGEPLSSLDADAVMACIEKIKQQAAKGQ